MTSLHHVMCCAKHNDNARPGVATKEQVDVRENERKRVESLVLN